MSQLEITYTNIVWYVNKIPPPSDRIFLESSSPFV